MIVLNYKLEFNARNSPDANNQNSLNAVQNKNKYHGWSNPPMVYFINMIEYYFKISSTSSIITLAASYTDIQ